MSMKETIVCGLDRSAASERAAQFAALLAARLDADVATVHVERRRRLFAGLRRPRPARGSHIYIGGGDPVDELVRAADALDAELVVVGSRGRRELGRALLGSVSSGLMMSSPCPVVVVSPGAEVPRQPAELSSVVCGVEGSDRDVEVLRLGADLAARLGGALHAVHAFEPWPALGPSTPAPLPEPELREAAERTLGRSLRAAGVAARGHAAARPAARALEECAQREGAALIVVGSQGHGKLASVVLGSVSIQLTAESKRPVVVLPADTQLEPGSGHYELAGHASSGR